MSGAETSAGFGEPRRVSPTDPYRMGRGHGEGQFRQHRTEHAERDLASKRVIVGYVPPNGERGPRYRLRGSDREFLRMNSNSYLSLSNHPEVLAAADRASHAFGAETTSDTGLFSNTGDSLFGEDHSVVDTHVADTTAHEDPLHH